jgi:hypothetical protein
MRECSGCRFWCPDIEKSQFSAFAIHRALLKNSTKYAAAHDGDNYDHLKGESPFSAGRTWDIRFSKNDERSMTNSALCRRNTPSIDAEGNAVWPLTDEADWCGEWSPPDE